MDDKNYIDELNGKLECIQDNIQWLIEKYRHDIELIEMDLNDRMNITRVILNAKLGAYERILIDLESLLDIEN